MRGEDRQPRDESQHRGNPAAGDRDADQPGQYRSGGDSCTGRTRDRVAAGEWLHYELAGRSAFDVREDEFRETGGVEDGNLPGR